MTTKKCWHCGQPVWDQPKCPHCGAPHPNWKVWQAIWWERFKKAFIFFVFFAAVVWLLINMPPEVKNFIGDLFRRISGGGM